MASDLNVAISLMNQASGRPTQEALRLLDQADLRLQNAIASDPSNARIFLYWGHLHKQRAQIFTTLGNVSEAEEQRRIAIDMYDAALKSDWTLLEARTALNQIQGESSVQTNWTQQPTSTTTSTTSSVTSPPTTSTTSTFPLATPAPNPSITTTSSVVVPPQPENSNVTSQPREVTPSTTTETRPAYRSGTYTTQSYSQPVHYNMPTSTSRPKVVAKAPQTSSIALLKKEEAAVLQELYSSASSSSTAASSGPKVCRYCNTPASGSKFCSNCGELLTI